MIETAQPGATGRANAALVQRIRIEKRCIAGGAKVFCFKRGRRFEALCADRNPRPFVECAFANAAVIRKKYRKNSVRNPANEIEGSRSR
jgi:hypothetical protein